MSDTKTKTIEQLTNGYQIPELAPALERGPEWLREIRKTARARFNESPPPRRGLALWRYTDPGKFLFRHDASVDTAFTDDYDKVVYDERRHVDEGHLAALVTDFGGREIDVYGGGSLIKKGAFIGSLSQATEQHGELVKKYLNQLVNDRMGKFEAMNSALWNDGIFIYVPDGMAVEKPLHLIREAGRENSTYYPRLLVVAGENSEFTLIDEYGGGSRDTDLGISNVNGAVEIFGLQNSRMRYVSLQRQAAGANTYLSHRARISRDATMLTIPLVFGANYSKQNLGVIMGGPGAESNMYGLLFGSGYQHYDNHTLHRHESGNTFSNIDFKVVLRDKANSAYTGLIEIEQNARTCEAYQENRNLLLNKGTRAETIPELEILNEDVKCSHGATIGPIDPEMIFYLMSRGMAFPLAVRTVVSGFVASTLKQIPDDLRDRLESFVERRLEGI